MARERAVFITLMLALAAPAAGANETDREVARSYAEFHLYRRDFPAAIQVLQDHLRLDQVDAAAWYQLGLTYLRSQQNDQAESALQKAVEFGSAEDKGLYHYYLADAQIRLAKTAEAEQNLELAARDESLEEAVEIARDGMRPGKPLPRTGTKPPSDWAANISLGTGYDSNVLLASDENIATATQTGQASPYLSPTAELRYTREKKGAALFTAGNLVNFRYHSKAEAKPYNSLYETFFMDWSPNERNVFGSQFELTYLNTDGLAFYSWSETLRWRRVLWKRESQELAAELPVAYRKFALGTDTDPADDRTGFAVRPGIIYRLTIGEGFFIANPLYERHFAKGANYKANTYALPLTYRAPVGLWGAYGSFTVEPGMVDYYDSEAGRDDKSISAATSLTWRLADTLALSASYSFRRNLSNETAAQYTKHTGGLTIGYDLF